MYNNQTIPKQSIRLLQNFHSPTRLPDIDISCFFFFFLLSCVTLPSCPLLILFFHLLLFPPACFLFCSFTCYSSLLPVSYSLLSLVTLPSCLFLILFFHLLLFPPACFLFSSFMCHSTLMPPDSSIALNICIHLRTRAETQTRKRENGLSRV